MVDICRDGRWGRMAEGSGEDPYLGAQIAKAVVRGYQGTDLKADNTMMACIKHFALYGGAEAGREYNTVDMSHLRMFNEYFPPYKAAVEAGAGSVMTSFNTVDYIPSTGNHWLLTHVLRDLWGFKGFVVTDYTAIQEMINHGVGKDLQAVSALALNAGTDMDMVSEGFTRTLEKSLSEGKVSQQSIDQACRRILEAKYKLGLFDDPYRYLDRKRAAKVTFTPASLTAARDLAAETFVLLKNKGNLLPLRKEGTIAVIGPLADAGNQMVGTWSVTADADKCLSLVDAMKEATGSHANILYAKGSNICYDKQLQENTSRGSMKWDPRSPKEMIDEAVAAARKADVIVAAIGEPAEGSGECSSRSDLTLYDAQKDLLTALKKTGKPIVLVSFYGRPTVMTWESQNFPALLNVWFGGTEAAPAICDVLFGDKVPSGHLTFTMPKRMGQIPLYYNHLNTGRPLEEGKWFTKFRSDYLDVDNDPLYPFGYGLSYTTFKYGPLTLDKSSMTPEDSIQAKVTVTNTGNYDGDEVVQLYIRDRVASISRPVEELKDFARIHLNKGESKTVTFTINAAKPEGDGYPIEDTWNCNDLDDMNSIQIMSFSGEKLDYPTQKNENLLERIITASSNPGDLVLDCFCGSGTTLAVAQKLGRRWIGCDINLGAIQTTTKRLNQILEEQKQKKLLDKSQGLSAFKVYNVNDYEIFKNEIESKEIIMEMYGVEPIKQSYFDGVLDQNLVKVMPLNRVLNKMDIENLLKEI